MSRIQWIKLSKSVPYFIFIFKSGLIQWSLNLNPKVLEHLECLRFLVSSSEIEAVVRLEFQTLFLLYNIKHVWSCSG